MAGIFFKNRAVRFERVGFAFLLVLFLKRVSDLETVLTSAFLWIIQCCFWLIRLRGSGTGDVLVLYCMRIAKQHTCWQLPDSVLVINNCDWEQGCVRSSWCQVKLESKRSASPRKQKGSSCCDQCSCWS